MNNKTIKAVAGVFLGASLAVFSHGVLAKGNPHKTEGQKMLAEARLLDKQLHKTVNSFKNNHMDVALYIRQDNAYFALFSSLEGLRHKELDPNLVAQIKEDGVFVGEDVMVQNYLCKRVALKRSPQQDEIYFVGKKCSLQDPSNA
jgi:hypothetical protein